MTTFAAPAPVGQQPAKPTPRWQKERQAELAAARSRSAVPQACPSCSAPTLYGRGHDHLDAKIRVDPAIPGERRTLEVVVAVLAGRDIYCRLYGGLHLLDRAALGVDRGQLALGLVREPLGPRLPIHCLHLCNLERRLK